MVENKSDNWTDRSNDDNIDVNGDTEGSLNVATEAQKDESLGKPENDNFGNTETTDSIVAAEIGSNDKIKDQDCNENDDDGDKKISFRDNNAGKGEAPITTTEESESAAREAAGGREAAAAREVGIQMIRDHLHEFLKNNPDASYTTWIATLHPENAEVTIDERFLVPNNPWWTVFEQELAVSTPPAPANDDSDAIKEIDNDRSMKRGAGVAAGIAGLVLGGPLLAVAAGYGAAHYSQKEGKIGDAARKMGGAALSARDNLQRRHSEQCSVQTEEKVADTPRRSIGSILFSARGKIDQIFVRHTRRHKEQKQNNPEEEQKEQQQVHDQEEDTGTFQQEQQQQSINQETSQKYIS